MNQFNVKSFRREMALRPFRNALKDSLAMSPVPIMRSIGGATLALFTIWFIFGPLTVALDAITK